MARIRQDDCGYALITATVVTVLMTAVVLAFVTQVSTEQKIAINDTNYSSAYYAAEAGLEKLNADLSILFATSIFPTQEDLLEIQGEGYLPDLEGMIFPEYSLKGGHSTKLNGAVTSGATTITVLSTADWPTAGFFMVDAEEFTYTGKTSAAFTGVARGQTGSTAINHAHNATVLRSRIVTLSEGDYSGLTAQMIPFSMDVTARSAFGTEARLTRNVQAALIPVFQFGMFADSDLSFFAGPAFTFNGRIHSNGNIFLSEGPGETLTLSDKITSAGDIIRTVLPNGQGVGNGSVNLKSGTSTTRNLAMNEGSLIGGPASSANPAWTRLSLTTYNGYIKNRLTGARTLSLPFVADGLSPIELIKRPPAGEATDSLMGQSRLANQAGLRVYISDAKTRIPGGVGYLMANPLAGYTGTPFAEANPNDPDFLTVTGADETTNAPLINGYIYIERQKDDSTWQDVTLEILNLGISTSDANAILRFQKPRWDALDSTNSLNATDYVPLNMYDAREARFRDDNSSVGSNLRKLGIMNIIDLNVSRLKAWFQGTIGTLGAATLNNGGYIFYFSDRRGNRDPSGNETGELGFEDFINPGNVQGDPNRVLDYGEDLNATATLEVYGANLPYAPYAASTDLYTTIVPVPVSAHAIDIREDLDALETGFDVSSVTDLTAGYYRIDNEVVNCISVSSSPITCARGQLGTSAATHIPAGAIDLIADITSSTTSLSVSSDTNVKVPAYYRVEGETVLCTSRAGNVLTCERGSMGTTAASHGAETNAISAGVTAGATSITIASSTGFPTTASWYRIENETLSCTRSNTTLTCNRGQLGTTAVAHPAVGPVAISVAVDNSATTFQFASTTSFTVPQYYRIDNEAINCSSKTTAAPWRMTCTRGQLSTSNASHSIGAGLVPAIRVASNNSTTAFTFASTASFSVPAYYKFDNEIVRCTSKTASVMTCIRAQFGTSSASHSAGAALQNVLTMGLVNVTPVNLFTSERASKNRVHYFRRALRLSNGAAPNLPAPGFTVGSENPIYVMGNYNSNGAANFAEVHSFAAVIGDAVSLLSNSWPSGGDERSFISPYSPGSRVGMTTWYRMAIASGKGISFIRPGEEDDSDFGTDGGTHNFLRYLEDWSMATANYRGSIISLYYFRQAVGVYKCCDTVYAPPTRAYAFDTEFLVPSQLPPGTPRFRDINNLSFRQTILADSN